MGQPGMAQPGRGSRLSLSGLPACAAVRWVCPHTPAGPPPHDQPWDLSSADAGKPAVLLKIRKSRPSEIDRFVQSHLAVDQVPSVPPENLSRGAAGTSSWREGTDGLTQTQQRVESQSQGDIRRGETLELSKASWRRVVQMKHHWHEGAGAEGRVRLAILVPAKPQLSRCRSPGLLTLK
ncbi:M-phase phosphoprotein 9 [Manis javanica]|nr:M-phase phosphoprotein 9 [Manis javanica]